MYKEPNKHDITIDAADIKINHFLKIRDELIKVGDLNKLDVKSQTYYRSPILSFAFRKNQFDALFSTVPAANGIRIYFAADDLGNPTLVILPCTMTGEGTDVSNVLTAKPEGLQYPCSLMLSRPFTARQDNSTCQ
ncbi:MAG: hypothetical protein ACXWCZ_12825 [Flavisolibacter sp.]